MIRIADIESLHGPITISRRIATGAIIYSQGGSFQSESDAAGVSLASYIHALFGLIAQTEARSVLMIGCGGGTLGTMLAGTRRHVTIVDVNATAFQLARRYFNLPNAVVCEIADGYEFLCSRNRRYDIIVLDAFLGDRIPPHLRSLPFLRLARTRLSDGGSIFANVHVENDLDDAARCMAHLMANVWSHVRLLDAPGYRGRNAIVMAGNVASLEAPVLLTPPTSGTQEIVDELATLQFQAALLG